MATLTEQKKLILPYLQRADEVQTLSPKVAYYLRLYAIEQGLQIPDRAPDIQGVLEALMEKLEQDRPGVALDAEDAQVCEAFAVTVFNRADKQDRAGKADANTVKAYYVATIFIDMLNHFGELPPDMAERQRYAAWKAADIRKALREGRTPDPGPPVKDDDLGLDLPDIPGAGPLPPAQPSGSTPPPPLPSGDLDLPDLPGPSSSSGPAAAPGGGGAQPLAAPRFRPGSKVWFNAPGGAPERGTVVNISRTPAGWACRVGLRQSVTEAPEAALAHDFAPGEAVLYQPRSGPGAPATVAKVDAARWPIAYLLTLPDGSTVPTTEASLTPAASPEQPAAPPPAQPQSRAAPAGADTSPAASGSPPPPPPAAPSADGYESDADESEAAGPPPPLPPPPPLDNLSISRPGAPEAAGSASPPPRAPVPGGAPPGGFAGVLPGGASPGGLAGVSPGGPPSGEAPGGAYPGVHHGSQAPPPQAGGRAAAYPSFGQAGGPSSSFHAASAPPGPAPAAAAPAAAAPPAAAPGFQPSVQQMQEAHKLTKYALSSLSFEDVPTAVANLRKALGVLEGRGGGR